MIDNGSEAKVSKAHNYAIKKSHLSDQVIEAIADYIRDNKISPGDKIPSELALAAMFDVGRNTVREAVKALRTVGILDLTPAKDLIFHGFNIDHIQVFMPFVTRDKDTYWNSLKARLWYEISIIPIVIQNASADDLGKLRQIVEKSKEHTGSLNDFLECDRLFHNHIMQCVPNRTIRDLGRIVNEFFSMVPFSIEILYEQKANRIINEHLQIITFIEQKQEAQLRALLEKHLIRELNSNT